MKKFLYNYSSKQSFQHASSKEEDDTGDTDDLSSEGQVEVESVIIFVEQSLMIWSQESV